MRQLRPGEVAWLALLPVSILTTVLALLLGPPLGDAFFDPGMERLWPPEAVYLFGQPEPTKQARYLIALLGPVLLACGVLMTGRRRPALRPRTIAALVLAGQTLTAGFVVAAVLGGGQSTRMIGDEPQTWPIFSAQTFAIAAGLVLVALVTLRRSQIVQRTARLAGRGGPSLEALCLGIALLCASAWLATAVTSDMAVGATETMWWTLDDPFAVLNGRTPLVDFQPVYAHLLPYPEAALMALFGTSTFVFTTAMACLSGLALLALYAILRRSARSPLLGLGLFLPVLALGFLLVRPDPLGRGASNVTLYSVWPMRYVGAYLLAWLTARHLDGEAPRRAGLLFGVGGVVALDNTQFGTAALIATALALAWTHPQPARQTLVWLSRNAAVGLLGAIAIVSLGTLARAGELPGLPTLVEYERIFGTLGWTAMPMPTLGFHLVLYATYVAAIATAAVRFMQREDDTVLTGMLAWSGTFGLLSASYFVGHSEVGKLIALFSGWGLALALLTVVVVRGLAARGWRGLGIPELLVLLGFAVAACALAQLPSPRQEVRRLGELAPGYTPAASPYIAEHVKRGEKVVILTPLSHRTAYDLGVTNVAPYAFLEEMATRAQMQRLLDARREEGADKLFLPEYFATQEHREALSDAGLTLRDYSETERVSMWTSSVPSAGG